jgi:hypothetical protein
MHWCGAAARSLVRYVRDAIRRGAVLHADQRVVGYPIEAQFGPLRTFVLGDSDYPNHTVLARQLQD